jgi:hypothetical protein
MARLTAPTGLYREPHGRRIVGAGQRRKGSCYLFSIFLYYILEVKESGNDYPEGICLL